MPEPAICGEYRKHPPGQALEARLGHSGHARPGVHRLAFRREQSLLSGPRQGERRIRRQNITGCRKIARKIFGEKNKPGRRVIKQARRCQPGVIHQECSPQRTKVLCLVFWTPPPSRRWGEPERQPQEYRVPPCDCKKKIIGLAMDDKTALTGAKTGFC